MRNVINLNGEWKFSKENKKLPESRPKDWEPVELPHTWIHEMPQPPRQGLQASMQD